MVIRRDCVASLPQYMEVTPAASAKRFHSTEQAALAPRIAPQKTAIYDRAWYITASKLFFFFLLRPTMCSARIVVKYPCAGCYTAQTCITYYVQITRLFYQKGKKCPNQIHLPLKKIHPPWECRLHRIKNHILFHHKRHPKDMGIPEIQAFISHLATERRLSASSQNPCTEPVEVRA